MQLDYYQLTEHPVSEKQSACTFNMKSCVLHNVWYFNGRICESTEIYVLSSSNFRLQYDKCNLMSSYMLWSLSTDIFWRRDEWGLGLPGKRLQSKKELRLSMKKLRQTWDRQKIDILSSRNHIRKTKSMCCLLDTLDVKVNTYINF